MVMKMRLSKSGGIALIFGALVMFITVARGFSAEAESEIQQLRQQLEKQRRSMEQQRQHMEALEKRMVELEAKQKEPRFEFKDIYDNGFFVRSRDDRFSLKANGFAQVRYTLLDAEKAKTKTSQSFDVALARFALSGNVFDPKVEYFFQLQGSTLGDNNGITMLDWWMKYAFSPDLGVLGGRFILPYSPQFYTHPGNLLFPDLSEADIAFNLPRTIGAHLAGKLGRVS